jgi:hypothetical protein
MREILIDAIIELAEDELEDRADLIDLARETEKELVERLIAIACFYRDQFNDVNQ